MKSWFGMMVVSLGFMAMTLRAPAAPAATQPADPQQFVVPELNVSGIPLGDVFDFLRQMVPNFNAVLVYDDPTQTGYPLVTLNLKQCSLRQVLDVMDKAYKLESEWTPAATEKDREVLVVRVPAAPAGVMGNANSGQALHVYFLGDAVQGVRIRNGGKDTAMADVLSLLKAALGQKTSQGKFPNMDGASMQVHEATDTLLFKGSAEQQRAVEETLAALDPNFAKTFATRQAGEFAEVARQKELHYRELIDQNAISAQREKDQSDERIQRLEVQLKEANDKLNEREAESMKRLEENERLKIRIEAMEAAKAKPPVTKE